MIAAMRILLVLSLLLSPVAQADPKPDEREPDATVTYRTVGDVELKLEIFRPKGWKASDERPAIIFFFGGGWNGGTTKQFYPQAHRLTTRGMVAYCADYRVKSRHQTTPFDAVTDAKASVRWLWRNAEDQGIDRSKIVASGGSAGGHLAACTGVVPGFDEIKDGEPEFIPAALVLFNPVIDTSKKGYGYSRLKERYKEISPVEHVTEKAPPTLIMVGSADTTTPPEGNVLFGERMRKMKRHCEVVISKGQKHGYFNARGDNKMYWRTLMSMEQFLGDLRFIKMPPR